MNLFVVDEDKCKHDGICVSECPTQIIEMKDKDAVPTPMEGAEEMCINCGHCVAVCPNSAISLVTMRTEDCPPLKKDLALGPEQVEHFLRARRSIRTYKDKTVEHETLGKLIDIARYAPTGTNSQQVGWLVINNRDEVHRLTGLAVDWMRYLIKEQDPIAKAYRMDSIVAGWESGIDIICRGAPGLIVVHAPKDYVIAQTDCTIALTFLDLAAPSFGLGTCWAGFFMIAATHWPPLQAALALPEGHTHFGAMMIGYPKYKYHRLPLRKEANITWRDDLSSKK